MNKEKHVVIIGAGKTGRGFLARLMKEAGREIVFIEKNEELIAKLREKISYEVHFFGNSSEKIIIDNYQIYHWKEKEVKEALENAELIFVSVGGENLEEVGERLKEILSREKDAYIITAENATNPAKRLEESMGNKRVKVSESTVFCTTIEKEGVHISSENYPYLQYNVDLLEGKEFPITTLKAIHKFEDFLTRKLYTYNAASCIIAYLGWKKGYTIYSEAANDTEILRMLDENYKLTNEVLCKAYGYDEKEQQEFALLSRAKFLDPTIVDTVERNARDPKRKLAEGERLLGPIKLLHEYGKDASVLEKTVAAALQYDHPKEAQWKLLLEEKGPEWILEEICGLKKEDKISKNIMKYYKE